MALTRIKSQSILDREVREQDLADGAITFDKLRLTDEGNAGDVLTVDAFGNLLFTPANGTPRSINSLEDVSVGGALNDQVLSYNATTGLWRPVTVPGLSASNNTYIVADIPARNALTPNEADQTFVRSGASGEWEMYLYDSGSPGGPWVLIATADSARTDANTAEAIVLFNTGSPVLIGNVSDDTRVTNVTVEVITPFDGSPTLSVGDAGDNARLINDALFDLSEAGTYVCNTDYVYDGTEVAGTADTDILAYFDFTGSTVGEARIIVTHV